MHHLAHAQSHSCTLLLGNTNATSLTMQTRLNMMLVIVVWLPSRGNWYFVLQSAKDNVYMWASAATRCISGYKVDAAHMILNQPHGHGDPEK